MAATPATPAAAAVAAAGQGYRGSTRGTGTTATPTSKRTITSIVRKSNTRRADATAILHWQHLGSRWTLEEEEGDRNTSSTIAGGIRGGGDGGRTLGSADGFRRGPEGAKERRSSHGIGSGFARVQRVGASGAVGVTPADDDGFVVDDGGILRGRKQRRDDLLVKNCTPYTRCTEDDDIDDDDYLNAEEFAKRDGGCDSTGKGELSNRGAARHHVPLASSANGKSSSALEDANNGRLSDVNGRISSVGITSHGGVGQAPGERERHAHQRLGDQAIERGYMSPIRRPVAPKSTTDVNAAEVAGTAGGNDSSPETKKHYHDERHRRAALTSARGRASSSPSPWNEFRYNTRPTTTRRTSVHRGAHGQWSARDSEELRWKWRGGQHGTGGAGRAGGLSTAGNYRSLSPYLITARAGR